MCFTLRLHTPAAPPRGGLTQALGPMIIPTRNDWGEIHSTALDAQWALKQFLGKSFEEAKAMFADNALNRQEDLQYMPAVPFNFYAPALANYLSSDQSRGDSDGASSFMHMLIWTLETRREIISPSVKEILILTAERVASRQAFYDADVSIYGRFSDLHSKIQRLDLPDGA